MCDVSTNDGRYRDLLDHAFLRTVAKTSAVDFRVPPTKVLELGCGVCFFLFCPLHGLPSLERPLMGTFPRSVLPRANCPLLRDSSPYTFPAVSPVDDLFSRVIGLSTLQRNGLNANLCA